MPAEVKQQEEADPQTVEFIWRFHQLRDLGIAYSDSFQLSDKPDVVHQAQALLDRGCPRELVAKILL